MVKKKAKKKTKSAKNTKTKKAASKKKAVKKSASKKTPAKTKAQKASQKKIKAAGRPKLPAALKPDQVFNSCAEKTFKFKDTSVFDSTHDIISQDRAVRAINMGLGIRKPGYNIYVAGIQGTGKTSVIRSFLERWSADSPTPTDFIYVYNFQDPETPAAITMPAGEGKKFRKKMETLIKNLKEIIPTALESEDYENAVNAYLSASNERKSKLYTELEKFAKTLDFIIKSSKVGIETIPVFEGRPLTEKEYSKLTDQSRDDIEDRRSQLEPEVLDFARKVRAIEQETSDYVEKLRNELGERIVGSEIDPLSAEYKDQERIVEYLREVKTNITENLLDFVEADAGSEHEYMSFSPEERDPFRKYKVNVFVDNTSTDGAPVIIETNPTYYNLFGRIEKNVEHGMYLTDFTMVKSGAVHRANGGYLVLNAMDVFKTPSIWDTLKRVLKNRKGFIEDMGEQYSLLPTSGLRPMPISLDVKVIMIGNDEIYHILYEMDEDFHKIFKIKADFDYKMPRNKETIDAYTQFVATRSKVEDLLPFHPSGVSAIVEFGSRLVEDQRFLSTQFGELKDLTIEADYIAREKKSKIVNRNHVKDALEQKFYRVNLVEQHLLEMVKYEDILLQVDGERVGQVNGLAVYDMGDYSFGKIGRITCTVSTSDEGIFNIERASKLSGKIHDKGVYILSGFLNAVLAKEKSIGFSASVCFEQSYGLIDGDSATVAELIAIISAVSGIPVKQNFAITGSLNQFGDVQPVGGVNEKIEGFFKTTELIGKFNDYNVLMPVQNVTNLMLQEGARLAVKEGRLKIFPIRHISEAFEIVTGEKLGILDIRDAEFSAGSALDVISKKIEKIHQEDDADDAHHDSGSHKKAAKTYM